MIRERSRVEDRYEELIKYNRKDQRQALRLVVAEETSRAIDDAIDTLKHLSKFTVDNAIDQLKKLKARRH